MLGAIRDKKLIPWDHDIDMGIINNSDKQIEDLIKRLKKDFYVSVKGFDKNENIWNLGKYRVLKVYPKKYLSLIKNSLTELWKVSILQLLMPIHLMRVTDIKYI